jgi:iron complex transport system substrate-binding protein
MRVVSLLPSATEMLYTLGIEPVGVSHECDYPPEAAELPSVIETRIDADASIEEINEQVADATESGGVYEIDRELLADLDPDIVVSQGICDVCAVDDAEIRRAIEELALDAEVVTSDPHSLADMLAGIERLGAVLGREKRAASLVADLESRIEHVERATPDSGPRVAVLDWLDPTMVAGHWVPGTVERCGAEYGLAATGERSRPREWAEIQEYDPDVLMLAPCGFGLDQTRRNVGDVTGREGWADLTAVRTGEVYLVDGHHYVNRPGPRLVETLELFGSVLHPEAVDRPETETAAVAPLGSASTPGR